MKKSNRPETRVKNKNQKTDPDWIIWAAWADRITFEEIFEKSGKSEKGCHQIMRGNLSQRSFKIMERKGE